MHRQVTACDRRVRFGDSIAGLAGVAVVLGAMAVWPGVWSRGEAREGLVVRDMLDAGHWVIAWRNGVVASKPPLFHWIAAAIASLAGWSDAVLRSPSVLAGLVLVMVTMDLGARAGGRRRSWLAAGVLLGTAQLWFAASEARVDAVLAAAIAVSLAGYWHWYAGGGGAGARLVCLLAASAAVLTKGPAGAVVVGAVVVSHLLVSRDLRALRRLLAPGPVLLAAAPVVAWYLLAYREAGPAFVERQLLAENVDRLVGRGTFAGRAMEGATRLPLMFLTHLLPWNLLALASLRHRDAPPLERFLRAWWLATLAAFLPAADVRSVYLLPLHPAVAVLAAGELERVVPRRGVRRLAMTVAAFDVVVACATQAARVAAAGREPLVALAAAVRGAVAPGATLHVAHDVPENDVLVVSYLAGRPVRRARAACAASGDRWLVRAAPDGRLPAPLRGVPVLASARRPGGATLLLACGGAAPDGRDLDAAGTPVDPGLAEAASRASRGGT